MGLIEWFSGRQSGSKVQGRVAARLRKVIRDFDTSQVEGINKLRQLCAQDPEMARVPKGIERSFFSQVKVDIEVAKQFKKQPDFEESVGLWEANLDWEEKERKRIQKASAKVDANAVQVSLSKLSDQDTDVIYESCRELRDMGQHALPALAKCIELLSHRDPALRQAAADVIAAIGKPAASASSALEEAKRKEMEDWAKDSIVHALEEIQR